MIPSEAQEAESSLGRLDSAELTHGSTPTEEWLSAALGEPLCLLHTERCGASLGLVSSIWVLTYELHGTAAKQDSLILKTESDDPAMRQLAQSLRSFEKEIGFYSELAPSLGGAVPRLAACGNHHRPGGCWLLLEDLRACRQANQVRGINVAETEAALQAIAPIHARFWGDARLTEQSWLPKHHVWYQGAPKLLKQLLPPFLADYELRVEQEAIALLEAVAERSDAIDATIRQRPGTLVHGDLRADNLRFKPTFGKAASSSDPQVFLLDWGSPTISLAVMDVAYLIGGSTPVPPRRGRIKVLLESWHSTLVRHGVKHYSFDEAWCDFQLATLRCLSGVLRLHDWQLSDTITPRTILLNDESIERFCSLVLEVDAAEALKRLP